MHLYSIVPILSEIQQKKTRKVKIGKVKMEKSYKLIAVLLLSFPLYVIVHSWFSEEREDDDMDYIPSGQIPEMVVR